MTCGVVALFEFGLNTLFWVGGGGLIRGVSLFDFDMSTLRVGGGGLVVGFSLFDFGPTGMFRGGELAINVSLFDDCSNDIIRVNRGGLITGVSVFDFGSRTMLLFGINRKKMRNSMERWRESVRTIVKWSLFI
jgi:hypothetical protein